MENDLDAAIQRAAEADDSGIEAWIAIYAGTATASLMLVIPNLIFEGHALQLPNSHVL